MCFAQVISELEKLGAALVPAPLPGAARQLGYWAEWDTPMLSWCDKYHLNSVVRNVCKVECRSMCAVDCMCVLRTASNSLKNWQT